MRRWLAGLAAVLSGLLAPAALACPAPSDNVIFHSCWGEGRLAILALPEDLPLPPAPEAGRRLIVTGAYTAREARSDGRPKPVGMFVSRGRIINRNLGRMDGVLVLPEGSGVPQLYHRESVSLGGREFDLTDIAQRNAFLAEAEEHRASVMQSHLLVADGALDLRPQEDAPHSLRRFLFFDEAGFGIYQTGWPRTLYDGAAEVAAALAPQMVLNLDMGSYDFCLAAEAGVETNCGNLGAEALDKLSNLLLLELD